MKQKMTEKIKSDGREFSGKVVSTKMNKTVSVEVTHASRDPLYKKSVKKSKNFLAHNELPDLVLGDKVLIRETKPISKNKHFVVVKKVTQ